MKAGKPVGGVDIILMELSLSAITDGNGIYLITRIPPGKYTLVFTQGNNSVTKEDVIVTPNTTIEYDVDVEWEILLTHEVTVYGASRRTERVIDAPAAVSVVEEEEIEREAAHGQIPKIMETAPGVDITQSGLYDFNLNTRGFNSFMSRNVLTFIDGMDMSNVPTGNQEWDRYSAYLNDLASMELIRGPGSAIYGANAFTGVLNISTRSPRYSQGGMVRLSIGELNMGLFDLRYAGKLGKDWYFSVLGGYMESKDFTESRNESVEYEGLPMDAIPLPLKKNIRLSAKIRLDKHFASGSVLTFETLAMDYKGKTIGTSGGRITWLDTPTLQARVNFKSPHWNLLVYGFYSDWEGISLASGIPMFADLYRLHGEVQAFTDFARGKGRIVGGFSLRTEKVDTANKQGIQTFLSEAKYTHMEGVFGQVDYNFTKKLKVVLAGRLDFSSFQKTPEISPKVSLIYTFNPGHSLRLSFNQAYLMPDYTAFYVSLPVSPPIDLSAVEKGLSAAFSRDLGLGFSSIPVLVLGNENLLVKKITSYEISYSNIFGRKLLFNINYYRNQLKNFITDLLPFVNPAYGPYAPPADLPSEIQTAILETLKQNLPPDIFAIMSNSLKDGSAIFAAASHRNGGKANAQGIELSLKYFLNKNLSAYFNYAWFDFDIKEESFGEPLTPNTPEHRISLGVSYISDRFDISMRYRWVDDFLWTNGIFRGMVKSNSLVDFTANVYLGDSYSVGVNISNLLNNKHYQLFGGDILYRRAVATFSYRW
jgi:iron complex outermembrane receptor protein